MFSRTSAGMSVLAAILESGSPGARASTENTTKLITSIVGIAIRSRRRAYAVTTARPPKSGATSLADTSVEESETQGRAGAEHEAHNSRAALWAARLCRNYAFFHSAMFQVSLSNARGFGPERDFTLPLVKKRFTRGTLAKSLMMRSLSCAHISEDF